MNNSKLKKASLILTAILVIVLSAVMLTACHTKLLPTHSLTLDFNDGRDPVTFEFDVEKGLEQIQSPTRTGYDFAGWTLDAEGTRDVALEDIANGTTLYAQWTKRNYKVRFLIDGQIASEQTVPYGEAATEPSAQEVAELVPEGQVFKNWDRTFDNVTGNLEVHAELSPKQCKATFVNGQDVQEFDGLFGDPIPSPTAVERAGFEFVGWFDGDDDFVQGDVFDGNVTYTARWRLAAANIAVNGNRALTYGDDISLTIAAVADANDITYIYEWFENDAKLSDGATLNVADPAAGTRIFTAKITARAQDYDDVVSSEQLSVVIAKKHLTATADDKSLVYGEEVGAFDITYEGLLNGDQADVVRGVTVQTQYAVGKGVGRYTATLSGFEADNYAFDEGYEIQANIDVAEKSASFTATASKVYDGAPYSVSLEDEVESVVEGLLAGHKVLLAFSTDGVNAETYAGVQPSDYKVVDAEGADVTNNYNLTFNITITIDKATIVQEVPALTTFTYNGQEHKIPLIVSNQEISVKYIVDGDERQDEPTFKNVGTYDVTFRFEGKNYNALERTARLTINAATITVKAKPQRAIYGADFTLSQSEYDVEGDTFGEQEQLAIVLSTDYTVGSTAAKTYTISVTSATLSDNFVILKESSTLTVDKAHIKVKAPSASVTYGEALDLEALSAEFEDIPAHGVTPVASLSTTYAVGNGVDGKYEIAATVESDDYDIAYEKGVVTVTKRAVGYTVDDATVVYGDAFDAANHTYKLTSGTLYGEDEITLAVSTTYTAGLAAQLTAKLTATASEDYANYQISITDGTLTVTKRAVTVKADDVSVVYGEAAPEFSYKVTDGNFYGEAPIAHYEAQYKQGDAEGCAIKVSFDDANHEITCNDGTLSVTARALRLSLSSTHAQDGNAWSVDAASLSADNLFAGDKLSGTLATAKSDNATYTADGDLGDDFVWQAALKIENTTGQDVTNMYNVTYSLHIVIENEPIEYMLSDSRSHVYDGTAHSVTLTVSNVGSYTVKYVVNGAPETDVAPTFTNFGTYNVTFTLSSEGKTDTKGAYTYTVTKREATLTANSHQITFGDDKPALGYTQSGLIEKDEASLNITLTTDYQKGNDVGGYTVDISYSENDNYAIGVVNGNITVSAKTVALTVTNASLELTYGDAAPELTFTLTDEAARDGVSLTHGYAAGNGVGSYAISVENSNANYTVSAAEEYKFTVSARHVIVKVKDVTVTYGETPTFGYDTTLYGQDTLEIAYTCEDSKNAGERPINATVTPNENYDFDVQPGTLTVNKAKATVTVDAVTVVYGDEAPSNFNIGSVTGLQYDDTKDVLTGTLTASSDYSVTTAANTSVKVTFSGLSADNYVIEYADYSFVVQKATLEVTLQDHVNVTYGDDAPEYGFDIKGFKNGDNAESIGLTITVKGTYTKGSPVTSDGYPYSLQANSTDFDNYTVVLGEAMKLTVDKANYDRDTVLSLLTDMPYSTTYVPGATVKSITLPNGFTWNNTEDKLVCNTKNYSAWYNADPTNYNNVENIAIEVNVAKATTTISSIELTDNTLEVDWNKTAFNIITAFGFSLPENYDGNHLTYAIDDGKTLTYTMDNSSDFDLPFGGIYKLHVSVEESDNWTGAQADYTIKIKAAKIGDATYTIEDALATATSGQTVTVFGDATISSDVEIKSGVTLLLPYDRVKGVQTTTYKEFKNSVISPEYAYENSAEFCQLNVVLKQNLTITNNGTLQIGGITSGGAGGQKAGYTSNKYAQLTLSNGAKITSYGNIDCFGYIIEEKQNNSSLVTMESGSLTMPFVVIEHRGGSIFVTMNNDMQGAPFNRFLLHNITSSLTIKDGAKLFGRANLYTDKILKQDNETNINLVGNTAESLLQLSEGSYLTAKFNNNEVTDLNIYGDMTLNSMTLTLKVAIFSATLSTDGIPFPVSWYYNISLNKLPTKDNATVTFNQDIKLLPGSELVIGKNVNVNAKQIFVADENYTINAGGATAYETGKGDAKLIINGLLTATGLAGTITSEEVGAQITCTNNSLTIYELQSSSGSYPNTKLTWESKTAILNDGQSNDLAAGSYTYNGKTWESQGA